MHYASVASHKCLQNETYFCFDIPKSAPLPAGFCQNSPRLINKKSENHNFRVKIRKLKQSSLRSPFFCFALLAYLLSLWTVFRIPRSLQSKMDDRLAVISPETQLTSLAPRVPTTNWTRKWVRSCCYLFINFLICTTTYPNPIILRVWLWFYPSLILKLSIGILVTQPTYRSNKKSGGRWRYFVINLLVQAINFAFMITAKRICCYFLNVS